MSAIDSKEFPSLIPACYMTLEALGYLLEYADGNVRGTLSEQLEEFLSMRPPHNVQLNARREAVIVSEYLYNLWQNGINMQPITNRQESRIVRYLAEVFMYGRVHVDWEETFWICVLNTKLDPKFRAFIFTSPFMMMPLARAYSIRRQQGLVEDQRDLLSATANLSMGNIIRNTAENTLIADQAVLENLSLSTL